jgi:hypothetical protein
MATRPRTPDQVRSDIALRRDELARSVDDLRKEVGKATDIAGKLRAQLPIAAAGALGVGFVLAGGIGASMRWLARRGREGDELATIGRFKIVDRG